MPKVPEYLGTGTYAEDLRTALLDGAPGNLPGAAVTLLTAIPGDVHAQPWFKRYIHGSIHHLQVDWPLLAADLLAGHHDLPAGVRALLRLAASLGADGVAVPVGPLLLDLDAKERRLYVAAVEHAGG